MRVVKRAQVDAQFPLPTGTADSVNVEKLVQVSLTKDYVTRGETLEGQKL